MRPTSVRGPSSTDRQKALVIDPDSIGNLLEVVVLGRLIDRLIAIHATKLPASSTNSCPEKGPR